MASSRRQYPFHLIEPRWQAFWDREQTFRAFNPGETLPPDHPFARRHALSGQATESRLPPKFYILDMFPYPSGAGLHVGHPEGYTATDILARYKRAQGLHVLHPMGWDAFGLPAEQYAIKTGKHPRKTTEENIATFKRQIKSLGFSYDWTREVDTTDPEYFKWTQWIFLKLYNSWFNPETKKAEPIETLKYPPELKAESEQRRYRDARRLAFNAELPVWWCSELGTVLANEEVIGGKSEVGSFPAVRKPMKQWVLRITDYAERLLNDLDSIDWSESLKEMQRNWIGRSDGAEVKFQIPNAKSLITVFTTRPDTLFGATYMVLAPEHGLIDAIVPENWPDDTPYYWKGQLYSDEKRTNPLNVTGGENPWQGQSAPAPHVLLTREQAEQQGKELGFETVSLATWKPEKRLLEAVPPHFARVYRVVPLDVTPGTVTLATDKPADLPSFDAIGFVLGKEVRLKVTSTEELEAAHRALPEPEGLICGELHFDPPRQSVDKYRKYAAAKSDLERTELAKEKTGVFTGAYAINPVNREKIPIWIADYVLANYGTGAIMAVPAHDERDLEFATKFNLPIVQVVQPPDPKTDWRGFVDEGTAVNSTSADISITGLRTAEAKKKITGWLEAKGLGKHAVNYKLRDWLFSRQRYWGEPFPIIWRRDPADGSLYHEALPESALPLLPPKMDDYKPTPGDKPRPPLGRAKEWAENVPGIPNATRELNTMPQWAGSCWYYLRYLDPTNAGAFVDQGTERYWMGSANRQASVADSEKPGVDLYVGGIEHAVLHLLYARFWHKVLYDLGCVSTAEPFFRLVNQGLILGEAEFTQFTLENGTLVSATKVRDIDEEAAATGVRLVGFHKETGEKVFGQRLEPDDVEPKTLVLKNNPQVAVDARSSKMSKSRGNVVNPDDILKEYGADAFRLYEMFMGPLQDVKPWNTKGVEGVYRFLGRVWRLFVDENSETEFEQAETTAANDDQRNDLLKLIRLSPAIKDVSPTAAQLKALHAAIRKVTEDLDGLRFNTGISAMMMFVNEAITWETKPVSVLRTFVQLLAPFAPHLAEELWERVHQQPSTLSPQPSPSLAYAPWPKFDAALLVEDTLEIPVQVNGKLRDVIKVPANADKAALETAALASEKVKSFLDGKAIKKVIVVPGRLVNVVVA